MFYSQFILAKKGPLGTIWIAAHLERKLRKNQVADTDIGVSVDSILFPEVPIALRLSSHLLLGVVRIYSKKVSYLFDDCSDALLKVKQAFRSTAVDLPPEQSKAPYHSITLPETFDLDDFELPDNEVFQGNYVDHHVSTREQITLQDTMDGVAFPTSQFGPDERFGDGDASQIGLDLDEDLFMGKGEAAGTSGVLMDMDAEPQASVKASSPSKVDDHNEGVSDPSLASPANYLSIQAPSTPGLMEEPNLPSAQEALISDDHMDEDHNPSELAAKEVSGPASSQPEPPNSSNVDFHTNGMCNQQDEHENEKALSLGVELSTATMEPVSSGNGKPLTSSELVEATNGLDGIENVVNGCSVENESNVAADIQSKGHSEVEAGTNPIAMPVSEMASVTEAHSCVPYAGSEKAELNGMHPLTTDPKSEDDKSPAGPGVPVTGEMDKIVISSGCESQNGDQPCLNSEVRETFDPKVDRRLSAHSMPVLQACNSHVQHACNGVDSLVGASSLPSEDDGLCPLGISAKEDASNVSGISLEVQDSMNTTLKADQRTHEVTDADSSCLDGKLENVENNSKLSDLPAPEKLRSIPNLPAGQSVDPFAECTPAKDLAEGDGNATVENITSERKRSFTESTLTIQSLNSAESSGATQSKRSVEYVPNDDDLLSSILVGRKSTALKMKPTPPVDDTVTAKRRRVTVHASAHKRKVLIDDAMVLHGDMIREQLTNTEDIRRVRKKAPCTRLEIWMLQKQFLEDEIFSEPVYSGMSAALISLHTETFDLSSTIIVQEDGSMGTNKVETPARPTHGEEAKDGGTCTPSVARDDAEQEHVGSQEIQGQQESMLGADGNTLQKEMKSVDDKVTNEASECHASGEKVDLEVGDGRFALGGEAMVTEQASSVDPVSEVNCNSAADGIDSSYLDEAGEVVATTQVDASCGLLDQTYEMQSTRKDTSLVEDACQVGIRDQEGVDVIVSEKPDADERLDGKGASEKTENIENAVPGADVHDHCSLPAQDVCVIDSVPLEGGTCTMSDQIMEECQPDESVPLDHGSLPSYHEVLPSDHRHDGSSLISNSLGGVDFKLESSCSVEADLSSQKTLSTEREDLDCWEADPKIVMSSTTIHTDYNHAGDYAGFGTDAIEHDTDFLNVDDDEVDEDYESDMPNAEEKRILDNTGWSTRTRAVANYLQTLFEKETQHGKDISLSTLLAGKSRKEASRMFFETLVLKTKDYIHAEQDSSFCDIQIKPRGKLMKSEF